MFAYIQNKYQFSDYQIAQLKYAYQVIASELSKIIIIALFFLDNPKLYYFIIFMMSILRVSSGGLHCKTYSSCLLTTFLFVLSATLLTNCINVNRQLVFPSLLLCAIICYMLSPVTADCRKQPTDAVIRHSKYRIFITILVFGMIMYHHTENPYWQAGYIVTLLNTMQLIAAKLLKKRRLKHGKEKSLQNN